ncbi:ATPase domain-containing protein [Ramlibacter albus]|uniref:non-specific serine/threonine protein kinase n=1 Tax=Ramlibacter albus TaxID=2079448 RepID=A0A923M962_9BURK|nr:ATPase domain-containing protein [Ramlibacter albus]MBC5765976.1 AAA family ATPase [Ramlibacter albus]
MRPPFRHIVTPEQERASTGIAGLDDVLGGGFPANHLYLIEGNPGAGKTTLGLQFLVSGASNGERGLYVTLSETRIELTTVAQSHGWSLDGIEVFELVSSEGLAPDAEQSILHPSEIELGETVRGIMAVVERLQPTRVVFDSLSEMRLLAQNPLRYRRQVLALKNFFVDRNCTVLLLDDRSSSSADQQLHSIAHGVIFLEQAVDQYGPERRRLRVVKMRGIPFRGGEHDFNLETGGLKVFPRLVAAEYRVSTESAVVTTGTPTLDTLMGGGLPRGTNTLFIGPSGAGKTTTAISVVRAAMLRGERAAYYLFDEGLASLLIRSRSLGLDVEPYLRSGQLQVIPLDPAEVSAGEFAQMVRHAVEEEQAQVVVIDSLNAYLQAMPGSKHLMLQMHELSTYLNHRNVVTITILGQHGLLGEVRSDIDMSYLTDGILLFRYFEARGSLLKAVSMVKSRINHHEFTIREFRLGKNGLEIGEELKDFEGVLLGATVYRGTQPLLGDDGA